MSEIQETYNLLLEIDKLLADIELKITKINNDLPQTEKTFNTFRQLERLSVRWLVLVRQMGLPDDANRAISVIARLIVMINMARMSLNMLAMSNPLTFFSGAIGLGMTVISVGNSLEGY